MKERTKGRKKERKKEGKKERKKEVDHTKQRLVKQHLFQFIKLLQNRYFPLTKKNETKIN